VRGGIISQANRYLGDFCSSQRIFPPQTIQVLLGVARKMRRTPGHSLAQNAGDRRVFWLGRSYCTARAGSSFLPLLQEVSSIYKTRNQLMVKAVELFLLGSPIEVRAPVVDQGFEVIQIAAIVPPRARNLIGKMGMAQTLRRSSRTSFGTWIVNGRTSMVVPPMVAEMVSPVEQADKVIGP
jgi:hypothetical protein